VGGAITTSPKKAMAHHTKSGAVTTRAVSTSQRGGFFLFFIFYFLFKFSMLLYVCVCVFAAQRGR
jgi:hypothetical protein